MGQILKWDGDGLSTPITLTTSTAGSGDTAPSAVTIGTSSEITVRSESVAGLTAPYIRILNAAFGGATHARWSLGSTRTSWAFRVYYAFSANPSNTLRMVWGRNAGAERWRLECFSSRRVALVNNVNGQIDLSTASELLSANTLYRIELIYNGTTITCRFFAGDSTTVLFDLTGTYANGSMDLVQAGALGESYLNPYQYYDQLRVDDTADWIGPYSAAASTWTPQAIIS